MSLTLRKTVTLAPFAAVLAFIPAGCGGNSKDQNIITNPGIFDTNLPVTEAETVSRIGTFVRQQPGISSGLLHYQQGSDIITTYLIEKNKVTGELEIGDKQNGRYHYIRDYNGDRRLGRKAGDFLLALHYAHDVVKYDFSARDEQPLLEEAIQNSGSKGLILTKYSPTRSGGKSFFSEVYFKGSSFNLAATEVFSGQYSQPSTAYGSAPMSAWSAGKLGENKNILSCVADTLNYDDERFTNLQELLNKDPKRCVLTSTDQATLAAHKTINLAIASGAKVGLDGTAQVQVRRNTLVPGN